MLDSIYYFIISHKPQVVFFSVFMAACIPVLYYYHRKNPNPRFRPPMGEMAMVTLFAVIGCAVISFGLGTLFNEDQDFKKLTQKPDVIFTSPRAARQASKAAEDTSKEDQARDEAIQGALMETMKKK